MNYQMQHILSSFILIIRVYFEYYFEKLVPQRKRLKRSQLKVRQGNKLFVF